MRIVIAPDTFKDALPAHEVARALAKGIQEVIPDVELLLLPLADGGEGSLDILQGPLSLSSRSSVVLSANLQSQNVNWGWNKAKKLALLESAAVIGLQQIPAPNRNPMHTSSYGLGQLIQQAINEGAEKIILAFGGSATNDAGVGMAAALGYEFFDQTNKKIAQPTGKDLINIRQIHPPWNQAEILNIKFEIICDVNNPLYGEQGAAHVFAAQKGASLEEIQILEEGLKNISRLYQEQLAVDVQNIPGSGAAGGLGGGAKVFLGAELQPGIQKVLELINFDQHIRHADYIITGEGKIDQQTIQGKVVDGVCRYAKQLAIPVLGCFGRNELTLAQILELGMQKVFEISPANMPLEQALRDTLQNLISTGREIGFFVTN